MGTVHKYPNCISSVLPGRIDIHLDVRIVPSPAIRNATKLRRVRECRAVHKERFAELDKPGVSVNGDMGGPCMGLSEVQKFCGLDEA